MSKTKTVKISSKSQITLPKIFLNQFNLGMGQKVNITIDGQKIEIVSSQKVYKLKFNP
jgi:AbrB family looped-hinge helix DNA binding protein